jgi:hypothetical protein
MLRSGEMWAEPTHRYTASCVRFTGADVFWLAQRALTGPDSDTAALADAETRLRSQYSLGQVPVLSALQLEGANLGNSHLEGASANQAQLDQNTQLGGAPLGPGAVRDWLDRLLFRNRNAAPGDIKWRGADLTVVPSEQVRRLGDERAAGRCPPPPQPGGARRARAVPPGWRDIWFGGHAIGLRS